MNSGFRNCETVGASIRRKTGNRYGRAKHPTPETPPTPQRDGGRGANVTEIEKVITSPCAGDMRRINTDTRGGAPC